MCNLKDNFYVCFGVKDEFYMQEKPLVSFSVGKNYHEIALLIY
jgi:hypothetical protein